MEAFMEVGQAVMSLLAESLGLAPDFFRDEFTVERGGGGGLRILHYPPAEQAPPGRYGANAHTDMPPVAMIQQDDAGGLETQLRDGTWVAVAPVPGTIAVQIGDALSRWTNDEYLAGVHHVRHARGRDRLSRAFFMVPRAAAVIDCLDACCTPERPKRYPPVTFGDFMAEWIMKQRL
jgi:isopenicillin N synthase-like dioxygenase